MVRDLDLHNTAAAAKSLQSCPTLCNPIDGSLPGSPVPGILHELFPFIIFKILVEAFSFSLGKVPSAFAVKLV